MVVMNFQDFFCPICLNVFSDFCSDLKSFGKDNLVLGMLVFKSRGKTEGDKGRMRIVEKQLEGFVKSNDIGFPFILDMQNVFDGWDIDSMAVILFDGSRKLIKKYMLPLSPADREEIFLF